MKKTTEVPASPGRLVDGLRDTGYTFNTAIADIIDNSLAANATLVDIEILMDLAGTVTVSIADNGHGMSPSEILEAMKYGSKARPDPDSLGKFGLGLKTASTAFCRILSVASRKDAKKPLYQATWDLDHIAKTDSFELFETDNPSPESKKHSEDIFPKAPGTVVRWEKVDSLFGRGKIFKGGPGGRYARNAFNRKQPALQDHIAMVFQRYLDPDDKRAPDVKITVNGDPVKAWDPFCVGLSDLVAAVVQPVEFGGQDAEFTVRAYVLPDKWHFPDEESRIAAKIENKRAGVYIYRKDRLISAANWLGIRVHEPHTTLLRVEFSFDYRLDGAWGIDIKKSKISLSDEIIDWLIDFLKTPIKAANQRSRSGLRTRAKKKADGAHDISNKNIQNKSVELDKSKVFVIDKKEGVVEIDPVNGDKYRLKIPVIKAERPGELSVKPVDGLDDNILFEPALIDQHQAVLLNTGHPYYQKVYIPNYTRGVTLQGMDSLFWALCIAEFSTGTEASQKHFTEMRFVLSRYLRTLVEDLPEPDLDDDVAA